MGVLDQNLAKLKKMFQPTNNAKCHINLRSSIPQMCVTNSVFLPFSGHQPWYWHLLNSDESDNNSDSVVTTYEVAVGNCSIMTAHVYNMS
jgi:hypothetical protein